MNPWLYALLCVIVPVAWGVLIVGVSNALEHFIRIRLDRGGRGKTKKALPPIDYHI